MTDDAAARPPDHPGPRRGRFVRQLRPPVDRDALVAFGRRSRQVFVLAAVTGVLTGAAVSAFEHAVELLLDGGVLELPLVALAAAPLVGLLLATAALRLLGGGASPATSEVYIEAFHDPDRPLRLRPLPARLAASVMTLGFGGAMGMEGPSLYLGAGIGATLRRRLPWLFGRDETRVLLVAGAAAGVAAIFKAPLTGAVFALEVPYRDDLARRALLPALVAAASSYVTFAALAGTEPILPVTAAPPFSFADLVGAVVLGLLAGLGARSFATLMQAAKRLHARTRPYRAPLVAGLVLAALAATSHALFDDALTVGPGYRSIAWALEPGHSPLLVVTLLVFRAVATAATVAGGGAGGLFIPLVVEGAVLGRVVGDAFGVEGTLFPLIGVAAFLGAGYRVPLAAVAFVAEFTGRPGFIVPGLVASVAAQLTMGDASLSGAQRSGRLGHLERRAGMPITTALETDVLTTTPDTTLEEFFWHHVIGTRARAVPVLDGGRYLGTATLAGLERVPREEWAAVPLADVFDRDTPAGRPTWRVGEALLAMQTWGLDRLAIVDDDGSFIGVVRMSELLKLDEILGDLAGPGTSESA